MCASVVLGEASRRSGPRPEARSSGGFREEGHAIIGARTRKRARAVMIMNAWNWKVIMMTTKFLIGVEASCMHCRVMNVNGFSKELKYTTVACVN
jgi:hypothetical protein